jgi:hypothetical protein
MVYQNKICGFVQSTYNYCYSPKTVCLRIKSFSHMSHLWAIPSHIIMIQKQEFKIQTYNVPWSVLILNALCIQNHVIILPP